MESQSVPRLRVLARKQVPQGKADPIVYDGTSPLATNEITAN